MIFILFGPPGAGKGTQGARIADALGIPNISTGAIFREMAAAGTPVGLAAKEYMSKGMLVPDEVVVELVKERIKADDCSNGFLLDGFPRTVNQATVLSAMLDGLCLILNGVLNFDVPEVELISRLSGRRFCPGCSATFHVVAVPPRVDGVCDRCGGGLVQRADDAPESVRTRLVEYSSKTEPVLNYYRERGLLINIDANASVDVIFGRVELALQGIGAL